MSVTPLKCHDVGKFDSSKVTDSKSVDGDPFVSRNTANNAIDRLGFPKPDAETIARRRRKWDSNRGMLCFKCGREYSSGETIYFGKVGGYALLGYSYRKVSYCESCKPKRWLDHGKCDTCNREVYFPYRHINRYHVFCSRMCERDHYSKVQRQKRLKNRQKNCNQCGKAFTAPRSDTKFCSAACKQKAYRQRGRS